MTTIRVATVAGFRLMKRARVFPIGRPVCRVNNVCESAVLVAYSCRSKSGTHRTQRENDLVVSTLPLAHSFYQLPGK